MLYTRHARHFRLTLHKYPYNSFTVTNLQFICTMHRREDLLYYLNADFSNYILCSSGPVHRMVPEAGECRRNQLHQSGRTTARSSYQIGCLAPVLLEQACAHL